MAVKGMNYGELIRNKRKAKGLTQLQLAHSIGLSSYVPISEYENNHRKPNKTTRRKLECALDISLEPTRRPAHKKTSATKTSPIGERIRRAREQKGLNQTTLGARLRPKVGQGTISNWEKKGPPEDEKLLEQLGRILGIRLESSSGNEEDQDQSQQALTPRIHSGTEKENAEKAGSASSHTVFKAWGPLVIPAQHKGGGWHLFDGKKEQNQFWKKDQHRELKKRRGVYIGAIKTSKGIIPLYVGKATKGFAQECFTDRNKLKYTNGLAPYKKEDGTPVMLFTVHQKRQGQINSKAIAEIETRLIHLAEIKNPNLQNDKHRTKKWSIQGIIGIAKTLRLIAQKLSEVRSA